MLIAVASATIENVLGIVQSSLRNGNIVPANGAFKPTATITPSFGDEEMVGR